MDCTHPSKGWNDRIGSQSHIGFNDAGILENHTFSQGYIRTNPTITPNGRGTNVTVRTNGGMRTNHNGNMLLLCGGWRRGGGRCRGGRLQGGTT